jgi:hypothetical protein
MQDERTFEMYEQARVLRRHVPRLDNFGLFDKLLELSDAMDAFSGRTP